MMLLLCQPSFGDTGPSGLGAVFMHSPLVTQNNFDLCLVFLHGLIQGVALTSWASWLR